MGASGYGGPSQGAQDYQERQQRQARELERPIICPECKSSWFSEVTFNQYSDIAMGSGTGGDIRQISMMPQTLRVCLCGHPYSPNLTGIRGRAATESLSSFQNSLSVAQKLRQQTIAAGKVVPVDMNRMAGSFAGITELQELREDINERLSFLETGEMQLPVVVTRPVAGITQGPISVVVPEAAAEIDTTKLVKAPASIVVVPPADKPHPNSKAGKEERAARLAADQALADTQAVKV